jgi:hypothetical protein
LISSVWLMAVADIALKLAKAGVGRNDGVGDEDFAAR